LKHDLDVGTVAPWLFPRLISRGSIEASPAPAVTRAARAFPRLISRGSIEARTSPSWSRAFRGFPRLISRGSIEASSSVAQRLEWSQGPAPRRFDYNDLSRWCTAKPPTNAASTGLIFGAETAPEISLLWQDDELLHDRERRNKQDERPPRCQEQPTSDREERQTHIHRVPCVVVGARQNERFQWANGDDARFRAAKSTDAGGRDSQPSDDEEGPSDRGQWRPCGDWQRPQRRRTVFRGDRRPVTAARAADHSVTSLVRLSGTANALPEARIPARNVRLLAARCHQVGSRRPRIHDPHAALLVVAGQTHGLRRGARHGDCRVNPRVLPVSAVHGEPH
jgi:hypothetical protein